MSYVVNVIIWFPSKSQLDSVMQNSSNIFRNHKHGNVHNRETFIKVLGVMFSEYITVLFCKEYSSLLKIHSYLQNERTCILSNAIRRDSS